MSSLGLLSIRVLPGCLCILQQIYEVLFSKDTCFIETAVLPCPGMGKKIYNGQKELALVLQLDKMRMDEQAKDFKLVGNIP